MALEQYYADLLAITSEASRIYQGAIIPDCLHRSCAVALMSRETITRLIQSPDRAHGATQIIDHFAWRDAIITGRGDVALTLDPSSGVSIGASGYDWSTANLYAGYGLSGDHHAGMWLIAYPPRPFIGHVGTLNGAEALIAAVAHQHAVNHDDDDSLADDIDAAYAASRAEWLSYISSRYPSRGFS